MELYIQSQEQIFFALVFTIVISIVVVTIHVKGNKQQQRRPPEPAGALPLIGHLHLLGANQLLHRTFADMADKYGPVFSIRLGIHQALVVSNWKVAKECFKTNDKVFSTRPKSLALKLMAYDHKMLGFAPHGQYWRDMRKLVTVELLSSRRLELLKHVRDTEINCFIKELYEQTVKSRGVAVVEMKERIGDLAMNIIVRMVAGKAYFGPQGSCDEESRRCQKALSDFFYIVGLILVSDTFPLLGWVDVLTGRISKMKRTAKELDVVVGNWVNEHRDRRLHEGLNGEQDFIDVMLSVMDDVSDTAIDMSESPGLSLPRATPLEVTLTPRLPSTLYG
ncbi:Cytochrome P450 [Corchorus olitorius]|uniref:Cytochrome P450 n=1 Tax=Corchorus olitorius TaxID=93759 RepID=A0A1R3JBK2_9ROSI|nr:Cytochrome P450 [Corchorus olitorius]